MDFIKDNKLLPILIGLLLITALSWALMTFNLATGATLSVSIIALAFIKVRLIVMQYMEANRVPTRIRLAFETWFYFALAGTAMPYLF